MTGPRFAFVPVMDHEVHVTEWGTPGAPALMLMHGLARTGRDFDELAAALSDRYHVLCPDMIGRGLSSWASAPDVEYSVEYYAGVAGDVMDRFGIERAAWLGTSMGGQIGLHLASGGQADRLSCLILNDIGPEVPEEAVTRILTYVGAPPRFDSIAAAETWLRNAYAPFGPAPEVFWQRMARSSVRRCDDGRLALHYDPAIVRQLARAPQELTTWARWERISLPVHVIHGERSDIATAQIVARMQASGPRPEVTVLPGCGHAPSLARPEDAALVAGLLANLTGAAEAEAAR